MINERSKGYSDLLLFSNFKISMHLKLFNISFFKQFFCNSDTQVTESWRKIFSIKSNYANFIIILVYSKKKSFRITSLIKRNCKPAELILVITILLFLPEGYYCNLKKFCSLASPSQKCHKEKLDLNEIRSFLFFLLLLHTAASSYLCMVSALLLLQQIRCVNGGQQLATVQLRGTWICDICRPRNSIRKTLRGNKITNTSWKCTDRPAKDRLHLHVSAGIGTKGSDSSWGESIHLEYLLQKLKYKLWNFVSCHWLYHPSVSARNIIWTCVYFLLAFENNVFILFH